MLNQMGWDHTFEHETAEGFSLDLAHPESKLAVEVDGPSHYQCRYNLIYYREIGLWRVGTRRGLMAFWRVYLVP